MSTPVLLIILFIAAAQWLACWAWVMVRPGRQAVFLASTTVLALSMFLLGPARGVTELGKVPQAAGAGGACAHISRGESAEQVRKSLGEPASIAGDEDIQGPGSETWVYGDARCVVHLLDGKVRAVDFE